VHRTTRSLSIAAALITVGALALPVSAAIADTSSTDDSSVTTTDDSTTSTDAPETEAPETEAPETEAPETEAPESEAPETEAPETEAPDTEGDDDESGSASESGSGSTPTEAPAPTQQVTKPWHVKARLIDADSAVVSWRDTDATDAGFSITLVPFGSASASTLPALSATGSTRSVQFDGLAAGTRYRATVTATTPDGSAVSAPSNVVVAPKVKHGKAAHTTTRSAKSTKHATTATHTKHAKPAESAKAGHRHGSAATTKHTAKPVHAKHTSHHGR
jgi:hypothetical protein